MAFPELSILVNDPVSSSDYVKFLTAEFKNYREFLNESITKLVYFFSGGIAVLLSVAAFIGWKSFKDIRDSTKEIFEREAKVLFNNKVKEVEAIQRESADRLTALEKDYQDKLKTFEEWLLSVQKRTRIQEQTTAPLSQPAQVPAAAAPTGPTEFRILWVDDNPSNNEPLIKNFSSAGIRVETVLSTSEALAKLRQETYSAVISDMGRAEGSDAGIVLLKSMKEMNLAIPSAIYASRRAVGRYGAKANELGALATANPGELFDWIMDRYHTA